MNVLIVVGLMAYGAVMAALVGGYGYFRWINRKSARRWKPFEYCPQCGELVFWAEQCGDIEHESYLVPCGHGYSIEEEPDD